MVPTDPLEPLRSSEWLTEAQRKAIHVACIVLPLSILYPWQPWPRERAEWRWCLIALTLGAIAIDVLRIHQHRVRRFFRDFFGQMIRAHERFSLLGSTYLLIAALLAIEIFTLPVAGAALGFTVLGDSVAALVGKAYGRHHIFRKTVEGTLGCLAACLAWGGLLVGTGQLAWPVALAGALVASLVEMLPIPLDDNLGVTLFSGYAMKLIGSP